MLQSPCLVDPFPPRYFFAVLLVLMLLPLIAELLVRIPSICRQIHRLYKTNSKPPPQKEL